MSYGLASGRDEEVQVYVAIIAAMSGISWTLVDVADEVMEQCMHLSRLVAAVRSYCSSRKVVLS